MLPSAPPHLPFVRREIEIGGRAWIIDCVTDEDALLAAGEGRTHFPFGLMLWESAVALSEALIASDPGALAGRAVLELGAGLGLAGVVAAGQGANVTQTDHDVAALDACARTARLNGIDGIKLAVGDWHDWRDDTRYDLVIGADVVYEPESHAAVLSILDRNLKPEGRALLADPGRTRLDEFIARAERSGWRSQRSIRMIDDLASAGKGRHIAVTILDLQRQ